MHCKTATATPGLARAVDRVQSGRCDDDDEAFN
jgi:hypothetical protein